MEGLTPSYYMQDTGSFSTQPFDQTIKVELANTRVTVVTAVGIVKPLNHHHHAKVMTQGKEGASSS